MQARRDGFRDEQDLEAAIQGRRQSDDCQRELGAWDASVDARPDEAADVAHLRQERLDAAVEKSVDRAQDVPEPDARSRWLQFVLLVLQASAAELCRPVEVRFEERSCAERAAAALAAQPDAAQGLEVAVQLTRQQLEALAVLEAQVQVVQRQPVEAQALDVA